MNARKKVSSRAKPKTSAASRTTKKTATKRVAAKKTGIIKGKLVLGPKMTKAELEALLKKQFNANKKLTKQLQTLTEQVNLLSAPPPTALDGVQAGDLIQPVELLEDHLQAPTREKKPLTDHLTPVLDKVQMVDGTCSYKTYLVIAEGPQGQKVSVRAGYDRVHMHPGFKDFPMKALEDAGGINPARLPGKGYGVHESTRLGAAGLPGLLKALRQQPGFAVMSTDEVGARLGTKLAEAA